MRTIQLTGGRGSITLDIVHINPNYIFGTDRHGQEVIVPQRIIADIPGAV